MIPNGVDVAAFLKVSPDGKALASKFGLLDGEPLILLPARITRRKNIELALRIVAALRTRFPQTRLVIRGRRDHTIGPMLSIWIRCWPCGMGWDSMMLPYS